MCKRTIFRHRSCAASLPFGNAHLILFCILRQIGGNFARLMYFPCNQCQIKLIQLAAANDFIHRLHALQGFPRNHDAACVSIQSVAECRGKAALRRRGILPLLIKIIKHLINQRIGITAFFGMCEQSCRLGNHQNLVILIHNTEMPFCRRHRFFLHKGLHRFLGEVKPEGVPCPKQFVSLCLTAVVFDAFFPQHFINKALGGLIHIFQQKLVQPLIFLVFGNDNLFQGSSLRKISCESMPDMR